MFTSHRLPSNSELHMLPPLPQTPSNAIQDAIGSGEPVTVATPSRMTPVYTGLGRRQPAGEVADGVICATPAAPRSVSKSKWEVDVDYPVLSTRQGGVNPPVGRTPSRDYLQGIGMPSSVRTKDVNQRSPPSPFGVHVQDSQSKFPKTPREQDHAATALYPVSPARAMIAPGAAPPQPPTQPQARISSSFNFLTYAGDASLIADCSLVGSTAESNGEDSFELGIGKLRPRESLLSNPEAPDQQDNTQEQKRSDSQSVQPDHSKAHQPSQSGSEACHAGSTFLLPPTEYRLDQSTLLPRSPARSAHLLASTNALTRVEPPWSTSMGDDDSDLFGASSEMSILVNTRSRSPQKATVISHPHKGFPSSSAAHSIVSLGNNHPMPRSSSGRSLASVGEEQEHLLPGDTSTLLPVSPMKTAHLLTDAELIARETLAEEASFRLPAPKSSSRYLTVENAQRTPRRSPFKLPPTLAARQRLQTQITDGDLTLDVKDLIAKVGKPKRASGTEESFVDLLRDDFMPEGLDATMIVGDEFILPASLRPRVLRTASLSPEKPLARTSPVKTPRSRAVLLEPTPTATIHKAEDTRAMPPPSSHARSKSLSRVVEIIERVRSERAAASVPCARDSAMLAPSPPKTAVRERTIRTARTPAGSVEPTVAKRRTSMLPTSYPSRHISLSVGAPPLPINASHGAVIGLQAPQRAVTVVIPRNSVSPVKQQSLSGHTVAGSSMGSVANKSAPARTRIGSLPAPTAAKARPGSTSSVAAGSLGTARARTTTAMSATVARTAFRPTSTTAPAPGGAVRRPIAAVPTSATARVARPSIGGLSGLPQPAMDGSARSAPSLSTASTTARSRVSTRPFGADASSATNRSVAASSSIRTGKLSVAPPAAKPVSAPKVRAMSTPATALVGGASTMGRVARPVAGGGPGKVALGTAEAARSRSSMAPPTSTLPRPRTGSTLARPGVSAGTTTGPGAKLSAGPPGAGSSAGLAGLRTRLDALQARQTRVAK